MPASSTPTVVKTIVVFKLEDGSKTIPKVLKAGCPSVDYAHELASDKAPEGAIKYQTMRVRAPRRGRIGEKAVGDAWDKTGFRWL